MKYFIDTEFSARGSAYPIDLISIGIVAENGRELYLVNKNFNPKTASAWIVENVLPLLPEWHGPYAIPRHYERPRAIRERIRAFIGDDPSPEFWAYYGAFDYVVLSQIMGGMEQWPQGWPYYAHDLRQWLDERGLQHVTQPDDAPHDALQDARWIRDTYMTHATPYAKHVEHGGAL